MHKIIKSGLWMGCITRKVQEQCIRLTESEDLSIILSDFFSTVAQRYRTTKDPDVSTAPLARSFVCSHRSLIRLLRSPHCSKSV